MLTTKEKEVLDWYESLRFLSEKEENQWVKYLFSLGFSRSMDQDEGFYYSNYLQGYYFYIDIEYYPRFSYPKIKWDIGYHFRESSRDMFFLSKIIDDYPIFINERIINFLDRFPFEVEIRDVNLNNLMSIDYETMIKELEKITIYLNCQKSLLY